MNNTDNKGLSVLGWIYLIVGIIYGVSPVDIIPDVVPVAGWVDDLTITGTAILNAVQAYNPDNFIGVVSKYAKWILLVLGILATAVVALLVYLVWHVATT